MDAPSDILSRKELKGARHSEPANKFDGLNADDVAAPNDRLRPKEYEPDDRHSDERQAKAAGQHSSY